MKLSGRTLPTDRALVARVGRRASALTDETLAAADRWYPDAAADVRRRSAGTFSPPIAYAVLAALSPRLSWAANVRYLERFADAYAVGAKPSARGIIGERYAAADAIASGQRTPADVLRSPKVLSFYRNLLGDTDAVTVDVWTLRAIGFADADAVTDLAYDRIANAIATVGERVGIEPRTLQAALWIVARGRPD